MDRDEQKLAKLMERAQQGDKAAYASLLDDIARLLKGFIGKRIRDREVADEIVQDILLSIHQARGSYTPGRPFKPWMFAIARYRLVDHYRKWERTTKNQVDNELALEMLSFDPRESDSPLEAELGAALATLPVKQRTAVELLKYQGFSIREAAQQMGLTEAALKVTAHRAYKALRRKFGVDRGNA